MESILLEIRHEQDVELKRLAGLQERFERLTEQVTVNRTNIRRMSRQSN